MRWGFYKFGGYKDKYAINFAYKDVTPYAKRQTTQQENDFKCIRHKDQIDPAYRQTGLQCFAIGAGDRNKNEKVSDSHFLKSIL